MSKRSALARIKQLCCLGLDSPAIMPALLKELHGVVPSYANQFLWADQRQEMSNFFAENLDELEPYAPLYLSEFHNRREKDVVWGFTETLRTRRGVLSQNEMLKVDPRHYHRHDFYNLVMRPSGYDHALRAIIDEGGPALGAVVINRAQGEADFTIEDTLRLSSIIPYFAHALASPPPALEAPLVDSGDEGLLIADAAGKVQHFSPEARRLLHLVADPTISLKPATNAIHRILLPQEVIQLCERLVNVFSGQGKHTAPPVWRHRNIWGGFVFRTFWLNDYAPEPTPLIGITVKRQEPLPLKLLRQVEQLSLSPRQTEVCLLLAGGHSRQAIAKRLDVSEHTAITYTRQVYDKLQVNKRGELINKLLLL